MSREKKSKQRIDIRWFSKPQPASGLRLSTMHTTNYWTRELRENGEEEEEREKLE